MKVVEEKNMKLFKKCHIGKQYGPQQSHTGPVNPCLFVHLFVSASLISFSWNSIISFFSEILHMDSNIKKLTEIDSIVFSRKFVLCLKIGKRIQNGPMVTLNERPQNSLSIWKRQHLKLIYLVGFVQAYSVMSKLTCCHNNFAILHSNFTNLP